MHHVNMYFGVKVMLSLSWWLGSLTIWCIDKYSDVTAGYR